MPITPPSPPGEKQTTEIAEQFRGFTVDDLLIIPKELKVLRLQHSSQLRKITQLVQDVTATPVTAVTFKAKQQYLQDLKGKQNQILDQILGLSPDDAEKDFDVDEACGKLYMKLDTLIANGTPSEVSNVSTPSVQQPPQLKIPMPTFDGTYEQWPMFKAMFMDIVDRCGTSDAVKLHHLNKALVGKASGILNASIIASNNFGSAWQLLEDRFENPRAIVDRHIAGLLNLKPVTKESAAGLRELMDTCKTHIDGLAFMKKKIDGTSELFVTHILASCFDPETKKLWERTMVRGQFPDLKATLEFLCRQCEVLDQCASEKPEKSKKSVSTVFTTSVQNCKFCRSDQHSIHQCPDFSSLSLMDKQKKVHKLQLCYNCLGSGHAVSNCESKKSCRKCNKRHHTLIHYESHSQAAKPDEVATSSRQQCPTTSSSSSGGHPSPQIVLNVNSEAKSTVLLSTVVVNIMDDQGIEHQARALLDSGAQTNFIAGRLAQRLHLPRKTVNIPLSGIGGSTNINVRHAVRATIRSRCSTDTFTLEMLVLSKPTVTLPTQPVNISNWNIPENYILADPTFNQPGRVDIILGAELFYEFLLDRRVSFGLHHPVLQESKFGWIVSGSTPIEATSPTIVCATVVNNIDTLMQKFFEIEDLSSTPSWSIEEQACEDSFVDTTTRDSSGKYIVRLPRKPHTIGTLGESRSIALRRFLAIERRLQREPETRKAYTDFMEEYLRLGHMSKVSTHNEPTERYYLPHHPVFKVDSTTTKCRVVFDASSKTSNGLSLNDTLMVGPTIQQDATSILMRFRTHSIALTADIAKMYRQVWVHEDDRALQRILWRFSPGEPIEEYELSTVTYGTASAPFLAIRALNQTNKDHGHQFPAAANRISDFYVDDFVSGDSSAESAKNLQAEIEQLYAKGGFSVRKWASNEPTVLSAVDEDNLATSPFATSDDEGPLATLGVVWTPSSDVLQFKVGATGITAPITKRKVSSCIAQIYDPLGIVDPVKAVAKQLLQRIWSLKKDNSQPWGWDDELPPVLQQQWVDFQNQLVHLKQLTIPRVAVSCDATEIQFHFFCDASELGYGACCYLRSINKTGDISMHLFASKTKVTPLKVKHSIARLELCAAHLSGQLYERVQKAAQYTFPAVFWTDSMTVIHWLRSPPSRWKPFVGNRVSQIQQLTDGSSWRHISGVDNPADLASRGCSSTDLLNSSLWWRGPSWICLPENEWPQTPLSYNSQIVEEEQRTSTLACPVTEVTPHRIFTLYSSYSKLRRMMAYWVQFFNRRYHRRTYDKTGLTTTDLKDAEHLLHRLAQQDCFKSELKPLQRNEPVPASSKLRWINPQLGPDGIIRVGGRLENSSLPDSAKHPVVILGSHPLASLLMKHYHLTQLHAGPQLMLSISRQHYWIINGRNLARKTHHECYTCFRAKPPSTHTIMADLPSGRVIAARPFSTSGIDYCGPILVKGSHRRAVPTKAYIAIFVCFITRAVHIELVSNLTTEAFISALRRFVARRGLPSEIHSDNATNFKGASNQLNEVYQMLHSEQHLKTITSWTLEHGICWKFIPPRAPHFGGLWEAAVKSMKTHLVRVVGTSNLSFEDMTTLLAEIECCLNSRPITPLTDDPSDVNALTPGHFLIGAHLKDVPDVSTSTTIPTNRLNHWQQVQQLKRHFWNRWHREYLQLFHVRSKWMKEIDNKIDVGTLVLVKDENNPSTRWPLARVIELHPGKDGIIRVATVVTSKGTAITRPIVKLCVLPKLN